MHRVISKRCRKTHSSATLELHGLVFGITHFRGYLLGKQFRVFPNNISLRYYEHLKMPSARMARLTLKVLDCKFIILHEAGKENKITISLCRVQRSSCRLTFIALYRTYNK